MGKVGRKSNPKTMQDKRKTYGEKIVKKKIREKSPKKNNLLVTGRAPKITGVFSASYF